MTHSLWDVLAYALTTLVTTLITGLALTWGVVMYVRRLHKNIMAAINALQQTDTTIADEQHTQTTLLQRIAEILTIANQRSLVRADAEAQASIQRQEITTFLINSGFFTGLDNQRRLLLDMPATVVAMVDAGRYEHQNSASLLATIVKAAGEYGQTAALCRAAASIFNSSQTGREFAARCAQWGIRLPPHSAEGET